MGNRPLVLLLVSAACFGCAVLPSQEATAAGLSVAAAVAVRFAVATAAVLPAALRARPGPAAPRRRYALAWLVSGCANTAGFLLLTAALERTTAATAAFLSSLSVVVVPVVLAVAARHVPAGRRVLGVALAVAGSLVLTGGTLEVDAGALLALGAAGAGALHIMSVGWFAPRLSTAVYNAGQLAVVAVAAGAAVLVSGAGGTTAIGFGAAAVSGLAQAAGLSLQARGQRAVDGGTAALVFTLVPVVALLTAWALDGQAPSAAEVAGGALVLLAVASGERVRLPAVRDDGRSGAASLRRNGRSGGAGVSRV
jgi:drug/metabolite transporter (DMT)-like permease